MKHYPPDARVCLIDGPVGVYIHEASEAEILQAYERLGKLVAVAAKGLDGQPISAKGFALTARSVQTLPEDL